MFSFATVMILGNIITEVYGYKTSRIVVWGAFLASLFLLLGNYVCLILKPAPMWSHQQAYETVLGVVPRFVCASLLAYCLGEFANSLVIAKMKIADKGEKLWKRIIVSSIIAITIDTMIFTMIAYANYFSNPLDILLMGLRGYLKKMTFEFLVLPFTCMAIFYLKEYEKMDIFDFKTNFTPFSFDVKYPESENYFCKRQSLKLS